VVLQIRQYQEERNQVSAVIMDLLIAAITGYLTYRFTKLLLTSISRRKNTADQRRQKADRARQRAKKLLGKKQMKDEEQNQLICTILPIISKNR
jgi:hypothetical protein